MKIRIPYFAEWSLGLSLGGILFLIGFFIYQAIKPPRLVYEGLSVRGVTPWNAQVVAQTTRRASYGCTNGIQADLRADGVVARLPVPLRTQARNETTYALVLPDLTPGQYETKVRESFICPDLVETVESPWIAFEVVE